MVKCANCNEKITKKEEERDGKAYFASKRIHQRCWYKVKMVLGSSGRGSPFKYPDNRIKLKKRLENGSEQ